MFCNFNKVKILLICKKCNERLDEPRLLQCGESICSHCVSTIQVKNREFQCLICKEMHEIPNNGLPFIKLAVEMLSLESIDVSRGNEFDSLQSSIDDLSNKRKVLNHLLENGDDFIKENCIELRNQVQLVTEEAIQQINKVNKRS